MDDTYAPKASSGQIVSKNNKTEKKARDKVLCILIIWRWGNKGQLTKYYGVVGIIGKKSELLAKSNYTKNNCMLCLVAFFELNIRQCYLLCQVLFTNFNQYVFSVSSHFLTWVLQFVNHILKHQVKLIFLWLFL